MMKIKKFYYVIANEIEIVFHILSLEKGMLPVLWCHQGLYGLISIEQMLNEVEYAKTHHNNIMTFHWDETIPILQPKIAKALLGEQELNSRNNNSAEETQ